MGQPLDPNNLYSIATIAATNPNTRIIAAPNPSAPGYRAPSLTSAEREQIEKGDFSPLVEPTLEYAKLVGVNELNHYGYSFGSDLALGAARSGFSDFIQPRILLIEPASVIKRGVLELGKDFMSANPALPLYSSQNGPARKSAGKESLGIMRYSLGLLRLSNFAIAKGIAQGNFGEDLGKVLALNPEATATVAWGTDSELADNDALEDITKSAKEEHGQDRVKTMQLPRQKHALANDLALQAALVRQGLAA